MVVGGEHTVVDGLAGQIGVKSRVDEVLVSAVGYAIANRFDQGALATGVGLIVAAGEEQSNGIAIGGTRLNRIEGGTGAGCAGGHESEKRKCCTHCDDGIMQYLVERGQSSR